MAIFTTLTQLICDALTDRDPHLPPVVPPNLEPLRTSAAAADAADFLGWPSAAESWAAALDAVATSAYSTMATKANSALWLRVPQSRVPRVAAALSLAGAIQKASGGGLYLD